MNLQTRKVGTYTVVDIMGRMDQLKNSLSLKSLINTLAEAPQTKVALNLAQVNRVDSGSLSVFVYAHQLLKKTGGAFCLLAPAPFIQDSINVAGLHQFIPIYPSENELDQA